MAARERERVFAASAEWEVYDWVVDYARPTVEGAGWGGIRVTPVELAEDKRSAMALFNGSWPGPVLRPPREDAHGKRDSPQKM